MQQALPPSASEPAAGFLQAAITVALAGLCFLLYRRYRKTHFLIWALAWGLYSMRLGVIIVFLLEANLIWLYWHQVFTGLTALALLWAALSFSQGTRWRNAYIGLATFPVLWSYIAIYRMDNFMLAAAPAVLFLSGATLWTGWVFLRHHRRAGSTASLLLGIALLLWGVHHLDYPFLRARGVWNPWGYYIDIVFALAMGAGILLIVGEELHSGLRTLAALTAELGEAARTDNLARQLLERAVTLPAVRGSALILAGNGQPTVAGAVGECAAWLQKPPEAEAIRVAEEAMRTRRPVARGHREGDRPGLRPDYVAALPVLSRDGVRGALLLLTRTRDPFAALDSGFLVALGRQIGVALENAELYRGLEDRTAELERLAARMVRQHEEERRRLSRELHDETAQVFAAVNLQLGLLRETAGPGQAPRLDRALSLVDDGIRSIRAVTESLRPPLLDDLGLVPAMRGLIDEFRQNRAVHVRLEAPGELPPLGPDAELALFRALQEALSNVAIHADAGNVDVHLAADGPRVVLRVSDDGRGLDADPRPGGPPARTLGGMGLEGMRERVSQLGGEMSVRNGPDKGAELTVALPLPEPASP